MEIVRDSILALIFLSLVVTQTPQGQDFLNPSSPSNVQSIDKAVAGIESNTDGIRNLLTGQSFKDEDFAQETTLSSILTDTGKTAANTGNIDTNTDNLEALNEQQKKFLDRIDDRDEENIGLFGGKDVNNRQNLFHIEATVPLNERRNDWTGNVTWTGSTYKITGTGELRSNQRGEYQAGSAAEMGQMVIVDSIPKNSEEIEWGYMNGVNGFYYGVNSTCFYVAIEKDDNVLESVCQENFNVNTVNTTETTSYNPEGYKLDLKDATMYQSDFAWYGGGLIEMKIVFDTLEGQETVTLHRFDIDNQTSLGEVSLPIKTRIENDPDNSTSIQVGGRQFSIQDNYEPTERSTKVYTETTTAGASEFIPALSVRALSSYDNVAIDLIDFAAVPNCDVDAQIRYDTELTGASWAEPRLASYNETLIEVDRAATTWQVGGEPSGIYLDFAQMVGGQNQNKPVENVQSEEVSSVIGDNEVVTLGFRADGGSSCQVNDVTMQITEDY